MTKRIGLLALACLGMAFAVPCRADNLAQNPHFDGTLDPWIASHTVYDADHSATADGTGSAAASITDSDGDAIAVKQCIGGIVPGATYAFGGTLRIPFSVSAAGDAEVQLTWHTASDCSDGGVFVENLTLTNPPGPTDSWEKFASTAVAPPGTTAAVLDVRLENDGPLTTSAPKIRPQAAVATFSVSIDDLFLSLAATPAVPTLGGTGIAVLLVSLVGAAFVLLRR